MSSWNGAIIGAANVPTTIAAPGVWRPSQVARQLAGANTNVANSYWPPAADASFANVKGLFHFQNWDTSSMSLNSAPGGLAGAKLTIGTVGGISSVQRKFLVYSFRASTSSTAASFMLATVTGINLGSGDYTFECWVYHAGSGATQVPLDFRASNGVTNGPLLNITTANTLLLSKDGSTTLITGTAGGVTINNWHHIAISRVSNSTIMYVDGSQQGAASGDSTNYTNATLAMGNVVQNNSSNALVGYLQEVRVTPGVGRYSGSTCTVPAAPFPDY